MWLHRGTFIERFVLAAAVVVVQEKTYFALLMDAHMDVDRLLYLYLELEYLCLERR